MAYRRRRRGHRHGIRLRTHWHRADERVLPHRTDLRRGTVRIAFGGAQGRSHRSGESADRPCAGSLRTRSALLHRDRAAPGRPGRAGYQAGFDDGTGAFHLLLGDAGPAAVGDEIRGATIEQANLAVAELGRLHAPLLGDAAMAEAAWLNRESPMSQSLIGQLYAGFFERYRDQIAAEHRDVCDRLVAASTPTSRPSPIPPAPRVSCTATTGWTTCFSGRPVRIDR